MRKAAIGLLLIGLSAIVLEAQFETGSVLGTVKDITQAVVPGAAVTLTNLETNITSEKITDENGNYEFVNVKPGRYQVRAEREEFAPAATEPFTVNVSARQRVDLEMAVGQVTETVEVTSSVTLVESDSSQRGQVVAARNIVELPLNGRNYSDLALLSAGSVRDAGGQVSEGLCPSRGTRSRHHARKRFPRIHNRFRQSGNNDLL
jgi:hypothetical protein